MKWRKWLKRWSMKLTKLINQFQLMKNFIISLKWKSAKSSMKKLTNLRKVSEELWTSLKFNIKIYSKWWKNKSIKKLSNFRKKRRKSKKEKRWLMIKEVSLSNLLIRWNSIRMRFGSTYSMKRKERILRFSKLLTNSLNLIHISYTICSKILFMLMTMVLLRRHSLSSHLWIEDPKTRPTFICLVMILILR